jgi:hypothetical protein
MKEQQNNVDFRDDDLTPLYTDEVIKNFNELWTPDKIKIILNFINFLKNDSNANDNVKSLEIFMLNFDKEPIKNNI